MIPDPSVGRSVRGRSFAETRSGVLDIIRTSGEISRVELARRSALTEATISKVVKGLIADGVIVEAGRAKSTGGKPATLLRLATTELWSVGVILDHPRCTIVLCAIDGSRVASADVDRIGDMEPEEALARVAKAIKSLLRSRRTPARSVIGIGVALAGRRHSDAKADPDTAMDWVEHVAVQEILARLTGIDVMLENDANCAALNEFWSGRIAEERDFAVIYVADGLGAGIVIDGDVYRGRSGQAGEIGHVFVDVDRTPCWCGQVGCLEMVGSTRASAARALADPGLRDRLLPEGARSGPEPVRGVYTGLAELAASGEPRAVEIIRDAAGHLATAVVGLANTLDLDLVILAGPGFAHVGEIYREAVQTAMRSAYVSTIHPVDIELRSVESDIAALGAASLVLHRRLTPHHAA
jgi:predicted NBD/HSP70 family sugar kinase